MFLTPVDSPGVAARPTPLHPSPSRSLDRRAECSGLASCSTVLESMEGDGGCFYGVVKALWNGFWECIQDLSAGVKRFFRRLFEQTTQVEERFTEKTCDSADSVPSIDLKALFAGFKERLEEMRAASARDRVCSVRNRVLFSLLDHMGQPVSGFWIYPDGRPVLAATLEDLSVEQLGEKIQKLNNWEQRMAGENEYSMYGEILNAAVLALDRDWVYDELPRKECLLIALEAFKRTGHTFVEPSEIRLRRAYLVMDGTVPRKFLCHVTGRVMAEPIRTMCGSGPFGRGNPLTESFCDGEALAQILQQRAPWCPKCPNRLLDSTPGGAHGELQREILNYLRRKVLLPCEKQHKPPIFSFN